MYKLIVFFILLFFSGKYSAMAACGPVKGALAGKVTDIATGKLLGGATVYIPDLKLSVVADSGGAYHFSNLPQGNYAVEVSYTGYKTLLRNIEIRQQTIADFALKSSVVEVEAIVVTGISRATSVLRSPVPIVSVNKQYLSQNLSTNIIDAIAKVPGVSALSTGPNVSKPFIRGLGYNRVLTLYDGMRQEGQQWGDEHGIEVDQYGIDRVEIIKGPASLTYGSDALAGVVNLIPAQPAPEGKLIGSVLAEYQTNNGLFGGSAFLSKSKNGIEWSARVSHKEATNYRNKIDGRVYNTGFKETDGTLYAGLHRKWGYSHVSVSLFDDLQEIPDGSRDSLGRFTYQNTEEDIQPRPVVAAAALKSYIITPLHQHVQHYRIYSNNSFVLGNSTLAVDLGFQRSIRREYNHPEPSYQDVPGLYLQLNTYSYNIKYYFPELNGWNFTAGVNGMYQHNDVAQGTEFVIPSYHQFDAGPFVLARKTIHKWDISGGLRYDVRAFTNSDLYTRPDAASGFDKPVYETDTIGADHPFYAYRHVFSGASGSIGATYNVTDRLSLKANIARGYRAPNIAEISSNGVHPGTNVYQIGNPDFKPEFNWQGDIGLVYMTNKVVINASAFYNLIDHYIFNQRLLNVNSGDSVVVAGNQTYKFQQGKALLYGGEVSVDIHPVKTLHIENSLSVVYALNKGIDVRLRSDSNRYLPFIPPIHGLSEVRYDIRTRSHVFKNMYIKAQLAYYARQNRAYLADNTETPTPGYTLFNAGVGMAVTDGKGKTLLNLYIMGNNLLDVAYFDHLSRLKYFYYSPEDTDPAHGIHGMGRNISFKIEVPF